MTKNYSITSSQDSFFENLHLKKINNEVFLATEKIVRFDIRHVEYVRQSALKNIRGRARICAHRSPSDTLHEMLIAIRSDSYIRPHRHHNKVESFHLIDGSVDVVVLNEDGNIIDVIELSKSANFYYRLDSPHYHTLLINSPLLIIHEITNGPFDKNESDWGKFSPEEGSPNAGRYIEKLRKEAILKKLYE